MVTRACLIILVGRCPTAAFVGVLIIMIMAEIPVPDFARNVSPCQFPRGFLIILPPVNQRIGVKKIAVFLPQP